MSKINPSVKAFTVLVCGLLISFSYSARLNGLLILVCLALLAGSRVRMASVVKILIPATLAAASLFFAALLHTGNAPGAPVTGSLNFGVMSYSMTSVSNAFQLALRIYAYAFLGMLFALTTDSEEFIYSLMQQCRLSPKFAYGVLAAYHLLPTIQREYASIRMAYKVKGYRITPLSFNPIFSMLVNTMHWSENVAMAMESKGFDGTKNRTYSIKMAVQWYDYCFFILFTSMVISAFIFL